MNKDEVRNKEVLSEEQQKLISDNIGLLGAFYRKEVEKGYIPDYKKEEFFSDLQRRFCSAALKYNKDTGFKFSTYLYGGFNFCVVNIKEKIAKDEKIYNIGGAEKFSVNDDDDDLFLYIDKTIWNSVNGWDVDYKVDREEMILLVNEVPLSEREKTAINFYYFNGFNLLETGKELGVSMERARQIIVIAVGKIKRFVARKGYKMEYFVKDR